jgi:hypothetical protein
MPDKIIDDKSREKLDINIKDLVSKGASEDDVMRYAKDFKEKFGTTKADFKAPKYEEKIEKPKSTSIFGEMPGPTIAVSESTKGQKIKQEELVRQEISQAPERRKKAVDTTLDMWAAQNKVDINSPKAKKQKSIYEQGIDSKEFSVSYGQKGLQLVRNVGAIDSYVSALKKSNDGIKEADALKEMSNQDASKYLNEKLQTQEITPERGTGILGAPAEFLGSATRMLTKQSLGSLLATGTALALAPETAGGSLAAIGMFGGTVALAPDMMKQNYLSELEKWYQKGKEQGMSDEESMSKAREQAERGEKLGVAEAVGFAVGGKAVGKIFSKPVSGIGVKNAMWNVVKSTAPEVASVVGVSGGSAIAKDVSARQLGFDVSNKEIFDDAFDSSSEALKFMGAMTLFHGVQNGLAKIPKFAKSQLKSYINAADPGVPETVLDNLVINKIIEPEAAENTKQALSVNKEASKVLEPLNIDDEYVMGSLTGKQEKKIKLQNEIKQLKENNVSVGIKEKEAEIAQIDEQMSNIHDTGDVDVNEKDTDLPTFQPGVEPPIETVEPVVEIPKEILSLKDDEPLVLSVKNIEDIPEEFRDRAVVVKGITNEGRKKIFGLPIGEKISETGPENIRYTITGKEAKDYAIKTQIEKTTLLEKQKTVVAEPKTKVEVEADNVEKIKAEQEAKPAYTEEQKIKDEEDAKYHGFDNQHEALNSVEKRTGVKYDKYEDIPKDVLKTISEERSPDISIRNEHTGALDDIIKNTEYENNARSAGLREQPAERLTGEIPSETIGKIGKERPITDYSPEQQQFIRETESRIGEQSKKLFDAEGKHEYGESYEEFLLRKGC